MKGLLESSSHGWVSSSKNPFLPNLKFKPVNNDKNKCQYHGMVTAAAIYYLKHANVPNITLVA